MTEDWDILMLFSLHYNLSSTCMEYRISRARKMKMLFQEHFLLDAYNNIGLFISETGMLLGQQLLCLEYAHLNRKDLPTTIFRIWVILNLFYYYESGIVCTH